MKLIRDSERVSPTGNIAPLGILNQLGQPTMDLLAVLVREAVQNSWDARLSDTASVLFSLDGWVLTPTQRSVLAEHIFTDCPPDDTLPLAACLRGPQDITVFAVSDRGTTGLGGPTRADLVTHPNEARDFVDFLRDIGQPQQKRFAGGTYGYGKAAFYRVSNVKTICVYTRCMTASGPESRFMATGLGKPFTQKDVRYTGRHWWGEYRDNIVEPILNRDADKLAASLGVSLFGDDQLGTTIVIIQPHLIQATFSEQRIAVQHAFSRIAEYLLLYCWPKMLSIESSQPAMRFGISWQGESIPLPDPAHYPPLQGFVQAMQRLKTPNQPNTPFAHTVKDIASQRPAKHLGKLALQQIVVLRSNATSPDDSDESPFARLTHHTALMRQPELIVNYAAGPPPASPYVGYTGVFLVDPAVDDIFAASEPPTHDAWVREALEGRSERIYVNMALKSIDREMAAFAHPAQSTSSTASLTPLGAFASMIGDSLVPTVAGPTARPGVSSDQQRRDLQMVGGTDRIIDAKEQDIESSTLNDTLSTDEARELHTRRNIWEGSKDTTTAVPLSKSTAPPGTTNPRIGRAYARPLSDGDFIVVDGIAALQIPFTVTHAPQSSGTIIKAIISAVLDGGQLETEPPLGGSRASVLCWTAPDGSTFYDSGIFIPFHMQGTWHILISVPSDIMLSVDLRAAARTQL